MKLKIMIINTLIEFEERQDVVEQVSEIQDKYDEKLAASKQTLEQLKKITSNPLDKEKKSPNL